MERKRGGGTKRVLSLLLAVLLIVTGIPMDTVYAAEDSDPVIESPIEDSDEVTGGEAANAEDQNKEEEPLAESTEEKEDNMEVVEEEEGKEEETSYKVLTEEVSKYVSVTVYTDEDGTELTDEDTFKAGDKVYVSVSEDKGYAHNVPEYDDEAELEIDGEAIGCYVFIIKEADLDLNALIDVVEGDGTADTQASTNVAVVFEPGTTGITATVDGSAVGVNTKWASTDAALVYTLAMGTTTLDDVDIKVQYSTDSSTYTDLTKDKDYTIGTIASGSLAVTLNANISNFDSTTATHVKLTITKKHTITVTEPAKSSSYTVHLDATNVYKVSDAGTATIEFTAKLASGVTGKKLNVTVTGASGTLSKTGDDYTYTLTNVSKDETIKIAVELVDTLTITGLKDKVSVTTPGITNLAKNLETGVNVYHGVTSSATTTYNKVEDLKNEAFCKGDTIAIALDDEWATATVNVDAGKTEVKTETITVDQTSVYGAYVFTVSKAHTVDISATLDSSKAVVLTFAGEGYTAKLSGSNSDVIDEASLTGELAGKAIVVKSDTTSNSNTVSVKIEEVSDHYKLDSVKLGTTKVSESSTSGVYAFDIPAATADTTKVETINVSTKKGNNLTLESFDTSTIDGVYTDENCSTSFSTTTPAFTEETESVVLYLKLKTTGNAGAETTAYKFFNVSVTTGEGDKATTVNKVADLKSVNGLAEDYLFSLNLGKLTDHTSIKVEAVKKEGYTVSFDGSNYTAAVYDAAGTASDYPYSATLPFVGDFNETSQGSGTYTEKEITLKAAEGYRFVNNFTLPTGLTVKVQDGGTEAVISGLKIDLYKNLEDKTLTIGAEVEETVTLTIPTAQTYTLTVKEDYDYHLSGSGNDYNTTTGITNDDIVDGTDDSVGSVSVNKYTISKTSDVEVKIELKTSTNKVSSVTIKADDADASVKGTELDVTDITSSAATSPTTYSTTVSRLAKASTLAINVAADKTKLQGILFAKGFYTVADSGSKFIVSKFDEEDANYDSELGGLLVLSDNPISSVFTLTISPETASYTIKEISYDGTLIYDSSALKDDNSGKLDDSITGVKGIEVKQSTSNKSNVELKITPSTTTGQELLVAGDQKKLEVVTSAVGLEGSEITGDTTGNGKFVIAYGADQYIGNEANEDNSNIFFSPAKELKCTVSGKVTKLTDAEGNVTGYQLKTGADYVTFTVNAPSEVDVSLSIVKSGNPVSVERNGNTFKVAAKELLGGPTITLDGEVTTEDISFTYNTNLVSLEATGLYNNELIPESVKDEEGNVLTDGTTKVTYKVRKNKTLEASIKANGKTGTDGKIERYYAALTGVGGHSFTKTESSFILTANAGEEGQSIIITADALSYNEVTDLKKNEIEAEDDGSYIISYGSYYYASVNQGNGKASVNKAELVIGDETKEVSVDKNAAKFRVEQSAAGKTVVLNLKYVEKVNGQDNEKTVASMNFKVADALTSVSVAGVVDGKLTQTIDTQVAYAVILPDGTSINDLDVSVSGKAEVTLDKDKSELIITTLAEKASEKAATIELSNNKDSNPLAKIVLDTAEVTGVTSAEPNISLLASTSNALLVKLEAAGVANVDLVEGAIAYKVKVSKQSGSKLSPTNTEFYVVKDGDSQEATLTLFAEATQKYDGKYDVTVQLVQLNDKVEDYKVAASAKALYESKTVSKKGTDEFVTKASYYTNAEELLLENQTNVIYRGQTATIADVNFGDKTSYITNATVVLKDAKGNVVDSVTSKGVIYNGTVDYKKLSLYVSENLDLGTYTIVVTADAPKDAKGEATAVAATASMTIKVEEGAWALSIQNVPDTLYKINNKNATAKASVLFNGNAKAAVKNKKVTWEIYKDVKLVDAAKGTYEFTPLTEKDILYGKVTVKNGTITVNKDYEVSSNALKNTFVVVATSVANPDLFAYKVVEVSNKAVELNSNDLLLATAKYEKVTGEDGKVTTKFVGYEPLKDQTTVSSEVAASNLYLIAVKSGLEKSVYTVDDLITSSVTAKSSNKKLALSAASNVGVVYRLYTESTMKNVKITVSAMDGGKASAQKTFTVDYTDMSNMVLRVDGNVVSGTYKYAGTSEDTVKVELGYKDANGKFQGFYGLLNAKIAIKGGKILSSDTINNIYIIKLSKDAATITINNKSNKTAAATTCTITNTAYTTVSAPAVAADVKQITANSIEEQFITYKFKKAADYKFVKIQIDEADQLKLEKKSNYCYDDFISAMGGESQICQITDGSFVMKFMANKAIPAGAYKLYFSYGDYNASGNFVPATKAGKVTVKAVASGKADYTAQTDYTMSLLDTAVVELTGVAGKDTRVTYPDGNALSTIVDGQPNNFAKFFEVKDGMLQLKAYEDFDSATLKELKNLVGVKSANDLTGYVRYRVNGNKNLEQVKVTVTLSAEALKKYEANKITMLAGKDVATPMTITADGKAITVKAAEVSSGYFKATTDEEGNVTMTSSNKPSANTAVLKIVPSTSFYADNAKNNGVAINVTVDAKTSFDSDVINIKDLSVVFDDYNGSNGTYIGKVPYTSNIGNAITKITLKDTKLRSLISFSSDGEAIVANVSKKTLDTAVTNGLVNYGETQNIDVTVEYCSGVKTEPYTFAVTFPGAASYTDGDSELKEIFANIRRAVWGDLANNPNGNDVKHFPGEVDFTKALEAKAEADAQYEAETKAVAGTTTAANRDKSTKLYTKAGALYKEIAEQAVRAAVEAELVVGADIDIESVTGDSYDAKTNADALDVTITFNGDASKVDKNTVESFTTNTYTIKTTVDVPTTVDLFSYYESKLSTFATKVATAGSNNQISNNVDETAIVEAARAYVSVTDGYRITAVDDTWTMEAATSEDTGKFSVELKVVDIYNDRESDPTIKVSGKIKKLQDVYEAATLFTTAFTAFTIGTLKGYTILNASTTESDILAIAESVIENNNIKVAYMKNDKETDHNEFEMVEKEVKYTPVGGTQITATVKTELKGKLLFTDEATGETANADTNHKFNNVYTSATNNAWTVSELKSAVNTKIGTNSKAAPYLNNDSNASKAAILKAATQAIQNAPYSVEITSWNWTQPTYTTDGRVIYTIAFNALDGADDVSDTLTLDQTITKSDDYQSFDEAVADIKEAWSKKAFDESWRKSATPSTDPKVPEADEIIKFIRQSVKDGYDTTGVADVNVAISKDSRYMTVEYVKVVDDYYTEYIDDCKLVNETVNSEGRLTLNVKLVEHLDKDGDDTYETTVNSQVITLSKIIDEQAQDLAAAKTAISDLKTASPNVFTKDSTRSDVEKEIKKVIKTSEYSVAVTNFKNTNGTVTCTITLTLASDGSNVTITW